MRQILACAGLAALALSGCGLMGDVWTGETGVRVIVTIPALESFVRAVGGEHVAVRCLCTKTGPHDFKTDAADLSAFTRAQLFLGVGLSLDDKFSRDLYAMSRRKDLPFIKVGQRLPPARLRAMEHGHAGHAGHEGHGHEGHAHHHHGKHDPHVWLGIPEAILMVDVIREELAKLDPENAATFDKNAKAFTEDLRKLQKDGEVAFLTKKGHNSIITFHDSFGYFANTFGLTIAAVMEETPGDNPDPAYLAKIVGVVEKQATTKPVACITVEPQYIDGSVKKFHAELKLKAPAVKVIKVDPMETGEPAEIAKEGGKWYLARMKKNIDVIADAMK